MNYDGATGWLVGDLHKGMRAMFTMMNEARLGVGLQGYAVAEAAYQAAVTYAKDRLQGRAAEGVGPAQPLIVHPDIRRNLMDQKAFIEGARALTFWGASLIDRGRHGDAAAEGLASLLIPVIKGFLTDKGFEATVQAQQIWGGHGYIEDNPASQFVRDARIAMIYEGANGVQALDLVGRKLASDGGKAIRVFLATVTTECQAHDGDPAMEALAKPLNRAVLQLQEALGYFMSVAGTSPHDALAGSTDFLHLMGHVSLGLMWLRMARAAAAEAETSPFLLAKLVTAEHYMTRQLPACALHLARIVAGGKTLMALDAEAF
jgi:hypothetical protein